jgi:hypothetical protein
VRRGLERRLARLEAWFGREAPAIAGERDRLAARDIAARVMRWGLAKAGIDPRTVPALRRIEEAEPPPPTPAAALPNPRDRLIAKLVRLRRRPGQPPLDPATATPAQLLAAICFGDPIRAATA